jgi:response regulator RpfG family c-di-GMP phosphodiesterase
LLTVAANDEKDGEMSELQTEAPVSITLSRGEPSAPVSPLVLIADADPASRLRRSRRLATRGFRVTLARTAFEAIVKASCHLPDFILMDESLGDDHVADATMLLATCPATAHIPVVRLGPGRRLPTRMLSLVVRHR